MSFSLSACKEIALERGFDFLGKEKEIVVMILELKFLLLEYYTFMSEYGGFVDKNCHGNLSCGGILYCHWCRTIGEILHYDCHEWKSVRQWVKEQCFQ